MSENLAGGEEKLQDGENADNPSFWFFSSPQGLSVG